MPDHLIKSLQARRIALGMSYAALSRRSGIARPNCSRILRGKQTPRLETVRRIARALNVEITATPTGAEP